MRREGLRSNRVQPLGGIETADRHPAVRWELSASAMGAAPSFSNPDAAPHITNAQGNDTYNSICPENRDRVHSTKLNDPTVTTVRLPTSAALVNCTIQSQAVNHRRWISSSDHCSKHRAFAQVSLHRLLAPQSESAVRWHGLSSWRACRTAA